MSLLPIRWRWAARCECGRMISALRWKVHKLRPGHHVLMVNMDLHPSVRYGSLTPLERKHLPAVWVPWRRRSADHNGADE